MTNKFTHRLEFPNGKGYTPCTKEYAEKYAECLSIFDPAEGGSSENLSPENYNRYCSLQMDLDIMLASGEHLGKSVLY